MTFVVFFFIFGVEKSFFSILEVLEEISLLVFELFDVFVLLLAKIMLVLDDPFQFVDLLLSAFDHIFDLVDFLFHIVNGSILELVLLHKVSNLVIESLKHLNLSLSSALEVIIRFDLPPLEHPVCVFNFE